MFFLLRCALCLSVLYAMILSSQGVLSWDSKAWDSRSWNASRTHAIGLVQGETQALVERATAEAADFCTRHTGECLADAARLSDLVRAAQPNDEAVDLATESEHVVPLPVPDPRRRRQDAKLTQSP